MWLRAYYLNSAVSNVTIDSTGSPVLQQRQNIGRTKITGVQTDLDYRLDENWRVSGGYLYNRTKVTEFEAEPDLVGTPRLVNGGIRIRFADGKQSRFAGW